MNVSLAKSSCCLVPVSSAAKLCFVVALGFAIAAIVAAFLHAYTGVVVWHRSLAWFSAFYVLLGVIDGFKPSEGCSSSSVDREQSTSPPFEREELVDRAA